MGKDKFVWDFTRDVIIETDRDALLQAAWALIHDEHPSASTLVPLTKYLTVCATREVNCHTLAADDEYDIMNKTIEAVLEHRADFAAFDKPESLLKAVENMFWHVVKERRADFQRDLKASLCDSYQSARAIDGERVAARESRHDRAADAEDANPVQPRRAVPAEAPPAREADYRWFAARRAILQFCPDEWPADLRYEAAVAAAVMAALPDVPGRRVARVFGLTAREERRARTARPAVVAERRVQPLTEERMEWIDALEGPLREALCRSDDDKVKP